MKKLLWITGSLFLVAGISGCDAQDFPEQKTVQPFEKKETNQIENPSATNHMNISIGSTTFTATLLDNSTARAFKAILPITLSMREHAGNEKYDALSDSLPTAAFHTGIIRSGDIMLFGSKTLVLFYKNFSTSYRYSPIGSVDQPARLAQALGTGNVTVLFELAE